MQLVFEFAAPADSQLLFEFADAVASEESQAAEAAASDPLFALLPA